MRCVYSWLNCTLRNRQQWQANLEVASLAFFVCVCGKFLIVKLLPMREFTVFRLHVSSTCVLPAVLTELSPPTQ